MAGPPPKPACPLPFRGIKLGRRQAVAPEAGRRPVRLAHKFYFSESALLFVCHTQIVREIAVPAISFSGLYC